MNKEPLVSIVTTVYNIQDYIEKCIESLIRQTYINIEIIIVNDCSTDDSMKKVGCYEDTRIKIIEHTRNCGAGQARKTGIEAAKGDYIITIDGDDWVSPNFIEALVNNAVKTDADIVSGGITIHMSNDYEEIKRFTPRISEGIQKFKDYANKKIIFLNNKLVRRTMYDKVPYSTRRYCEDTPVILPLLYYANKVSYVDNQGYYYRQHNNSLCHKVNLFEDALFKALCSKDSMAFFADKGEEYQGMISITEFVGYLKTLKETMTEELLESYKHELGELMPPVLQMLKFDKIC